MKMPLTRIVLAFALCCSCAAQAASFFGADDDKDKPWKEAEVTLPAAPQTGDLASFYVSPVATLSFAVDVKSITVDEDKVVRYTLVASSPSGAKNVSYEGIRCSTKTWKSYAYGRADGSWARTKRDEWKPIDGNAVNRSQAALAQDYFCEGSAPAGTPAQLAARLRASAPR